MMEWVREHNVELLLATNFLVVFGLLATNWFRTWLYHAHSNHHADMDLALGLLQDQFTRSIKALFECADEGGEEHAILRSSRGKESLQNAARSSRQIAKLELYSKWLHRVLRTGHVVAWFGVLVVLGGVILLAVGVPGWLWSVWLLVFAALLLLTVGAAIAGSCLESAFMQITRSVRAGVTDSGSGAND